MGLKGPRAKAYTALAHEDELAVGHHRCMARGNRIIPMDAAELLLLCTGQVGVGGGLVGTGAAR